jgi:hypothetical protein
LEKEIGYKTVNFLAPIERERDFFSQNIKEKFFGGKYLAKGL